MSKRFRARYRQTDRQRARAELTVCAMPLCNGTPIVHAERGPLGICALCALDVADHFAMLKDRKPLTERQVQRRLREMAERERRQAEAESRALAPGWIYYLRVADRIKVGYSVDVKRRMRSYPPHAELLAVHPGTPTLEREMHAKLAAHLAQGREWFRPTAEVMEHVASVLAEFGPPPKAMVYTFREGTRQEIKPRHRVRGVS